MLHCRPMGPDPKDTVYYGRMFGGDFGLVPERFIAAPTVPAMIAVPNVRCEAIAPAPQSSATLGWRCSAAMTSVNPATAEAYAIARAMATTRAVPPIATAGTNAMAPSTSAGGTR